MPKRRRQGDDLDQAASDADQTGADADQTASDTDQTASDRDQALSEADQRSSNRDQATANRELAAHPPDEESRREYELSRRERDQGTLDRRGTRIIREQVAAERDEAARRRDEIARERDRVAEERDRAAEKFNHEAERLAQELGETDARTAAALEAAAVARGRAASGRGRAAADRERAARDRETAARDRELHQHELERAELDELTGAYRRGLGEVALGSEIERAGRSGRGLVLAFIDVDGLKELNDRHGHAAGDALLRDVASALRSRLRPYDPLVRWGGDEFICAISETELEDARLRIEEVRGLLAETRPDASISVGLAALLQGDTLEALISRGDEDLLRARRKPELAAESLIEGSTELLRLSREKGQPEGQTAAFMQSAASRPKRPFRPTGRGNSKNAQGGSQEWNPSREHRAPTSFGSCSRPTAAPVHGHVMPSGSVSRRRSRAQPSVT